MCMCIFAHSDACVLRLHVPVHVHVHVHLHLRPLRHLRHR
jgi:hypothetical protein